MRLAHALLIALIAVCGFACGQAWAGKCNGGATVTSTLTVSANCDGAGSTPLTLGTGANVTINSGVTVSNNAASGRNGDPVSVLSSTTAATITNNGTISTASQFGVTNNGVLTSITNFGRITSGVRRGIVNFGTIDTVTNVGSLVGPFAGLSNSGTIHTVNNLQGAGNASGSMTVAAALPQNYNIIIDSTSLFGRMNNVGATGTMAFNIYGNTGTTLVSGVAASTVAIGTYADVLQGFSTLTGISGTSGSYNGFSYSLVADNANSGAWNLVVSGLQMSTGVTGQTGNLGTSLNPKLDGGTLQVSTAGTVATPLTVTTNNGTIDQHGLAAVFSGVIANDAAGQPGKITIVNSGSGGSVTFGGANTYTGGTEIDAGATLVIASGAALGSGPLVLVGGVSTPATLSTTASTTIGNAIIVSGDPVFNVGPGTTTTISSVIADGATPGDVVAQGGGTLNLTAANTYSGNTAIAAGSTLRLSGAGSIASSSAVSNSGTFNIVNAASPVTLGGSYAQTATGALAVGVSPTQAGRLAVAGTASLAGTLSVTPVAGTYLRGMRFTILSASSIGGAFTTLEDTAPGLATFTLAYTPTGIELVASGNLASNFQAAAATANERTIATALDRLSPTVSTGSFNTLLDTIAALAPSAQQQAFDQLGASIGADLSTAAAQNLRALTSAVHARSAGFPPGSGAEAPLTASRSRPIQVAAASNFALGPALAEPSRATVWSQGVGAWGRLDDDATAPGFRSTLGGGAFGIETRFGDDHARDLRAGVMLGAVNNQFRVNGIPQSGTQNTYVIGLYGSAGPRSGATLGGLIADGMLLGAYNKATTDRQIAVAGAAAHGRTDGVGLAVDGGVGYPIALGSGGASGGSMLVPRAGLTYTYDIENAYTESGASGADLSVESKHHSLLQTSLGTTLLTTLALGDETGRDGSRPLTLDVHLAWLHELFDPRARINAAFAGVAGSSFTSSSAAPSRDAAAFGLGLAGSPHWAPNLAIYGRYDAVLSGNLRSQAVTAGLRFSW